MGRSHGLVGRTARRSSGDYTLVAGSDFTITVRREFLDVHVVGHRAFAIPRRLVFGFDVDPTRPGGATPRRELVIGSVGRRRRHAHSVVVGLEPPMELSGGRLRAALHLSPPYRRHEGRLLCDALRFPCNDPDAVASAMTSWGTMRQPQLVAELWRAIGSTDEPDRVADVALDAARAARGVPLTLRLGAIAFTLDVAAFLVGVWSLVASSRTGKIAACAFGVVALLTTTLAWRSFQRMERARRVTHWDGARDSLAWKPRRAATSWRTRRIEASYLALVLVPVALALWLRM